MTDKLDMTSPDLVSQNIQNIAQLFPNCVTESANGLTIDFDQLKQELSKDIVEGNKERYRLEWPGKREAIVTANLPINKTLRPCREESIDFDNTENLYIEGDNLEVLKLLQESYLGKIKMIYIDPPYNTGKDFVYKDNFTQDTDEFQEEAGLKDEYNNRLVANPDTSGRYHSDWLTMMYPRLKLARNLLTDDGVIFISIDDNEVHNLRKISDEVFGEGNFVANSIVINNPRGRQSDTHLATTHEYLIIIAKNIDLCILNGKQLDDKQKSEFNFSDSNGEKYRLLGLRQRGSASKREERPEMYFPIYVDPINLEISFEEKDGLEEVLPRKSDGTDGRWMWGKTKCKNDVNLLVAKKIERRNEFDIFVKDYLNKNENERTRKFKSLWDEKSYNNQTGTQEVKSLLNGDYMSFPKSKSLLIDICTMGSDKSGIILDFFSGSATTAHAVMQLNSEDGGKRKHIMVQVPERTDEKSEAFKAGYDTICEIGKERIRRAGKLIVNDKLLMVNEKKASLEKLKNDGSLLKNEEKINELQAEIDNLQFTINNLDTGFRVYKLDSSNMQEVYYTPNQYEQGQLDLLSDNIKPDRNSDDLVAQIMLDWGLPLSLKIEQTKIANKEVYKVADDALLCCFDEGIDEAFAKEITTLKPLRIVFKDKSFKDDTAKENVKQLLKQLSPDSEMKVI